MQPDKIAFPRALPWLAGAVVLLATGLLIGIWYEPYPDLEAAIFNENGPVETVEMLALALAMTVFIFRAIRSDDPVSLICIVIAFLLANAILRETPRCDSPFYDRGMCVPTRLWKNGFVFVLLAITSTGLWVRRRHLREVFSIRWPLMFWPLLAALALLVIAEIAEDFSVMGTEETLEAFAYFYSAAFGLWIHKNS